MTIAITVGFLPSLTSILNQRILRPVRNLKTTFSYQGIQVIATKASR